MKVFVFLKIFDAGGKTFINSLSKIDYKNLKLSFFLYEKSSKNIKLSKNIYFLASNPPTSPRPSFIKFLIFIKNTLKTYFLLNKETPDIIISSDVYSFIILHIILMFSKRKYILVFRCAENLPIHLHNKPGFLYHFVLISVIKLLIRRTHFFIFTSKNMSNDFSRIYKIPRGARRFIIPNGISLNISKNHPSSLNEVEKNIFKKKTTKIISVGRFDEPKDFGTIIKSFKLIHGVYPDTDLILIGDGKLKNQLINLAKDLGLKKNVRFLGWKNDTTPYLVNSHIYIYSSFYEGFGYVILEAMRCGLPVIATKTPYGPADILNKNTFGISVDIGNFRKMAESTISIIKDAEKRSKLKKLSLIRAKDYDIKYFYDNYRRMLTEVSKRI